MRAVIRLTRAAKAAGKSCGIPSDQNGPGAMFSFKMAIHIDHINTESDD